MKAFLKAGLAFAALAGTTVAATSPADAQRWGGRYGRGGGWGGYHHYHGGTGAAVGAGILGLAVGAAIASNNRSRYDGYYGGGYDRGYYGGSGYYGSDYVRECDVRRQWDPYIGRYVRVRECY